MSNRKRADAPPAEAPADSANPPDPQKESERQMKAEKRKLVRRVHLMTIAAAWIITVPLSALLAAVLFHLVSAAVV